MRKLRLISMWKPAQSHQLVSGSGYIRTQSSHSSLLYSMTPITQWSRYHKPWFTSAYTEDHRRPITWPWSQNHGRDWLRTQSCLALPLWCLSCPLQWALKPWPSFYLPVLQCHGWRQIWHPQPVMMLNKFFSWQHRPLLNTWKAVSALCCPKHS